MRATARRASARGKGERGSKARAHPRAPWRGRGRRGWTAAATNWCGGARAAAAKLRTATSIGSLSGRFLWRGGSRRRGGPDGLLRFAPGTLKQRRRARPARAVLRPWRASREPRGETGSRGQVRTGRGRSSGLGCGSSSQERGRGRGLGDLVRAARAGKLVRSLQSQGGRRPRFTNKSLGVLSSSRAGPWGYYK